MLIFLGLVCVVWTTFELSRLWVAARERDTFAAAMMQSASPVHASRPTEATDPGQRPRRARPLAAWDDRGRPVTVEDLGQR